MSSKRIANVGGQALIEGILMRGPNTSAMSVRLPDGTIQTELKDFKSLRNKNKFFSLPLIRGVVGFVESMIIGYKCLMESADLSTTEEEQELSKFEKWLNDKFGDKIMTAVGVFSSILGLAISVLLFIYLPTYLVDIADGHFAHNSLSNLHPLFEGIIKIVIFVLYLAAISKMKDINRVFMYHGAEHKTIFCYEHGKELTVENVKKFKRFHPRCGTSFLFLLIIIGILISTILILLFPVLNSVRWLWVLIKILLIPAIMGLGYEYIRYAGSHENTVTKIISAPGLWIQRLTTKEPTDDIIEVGIESLKAVLNNDESLDVL